MSKKVHSRPDPRFNLNDPRFTNESKNPSAASITSLKPVQEVDTRFLRDFDAVPLQSHQQQQRKRKRKPTDDGDDAVLVNNEYDREVSKDATDAISAADGGVSSIPAIVSKQKKSNESIHERLDRLSRMSRGEIDIDEGGNSSSSSEDEEEEEEEDEKKKKKKEEGVEDDDEEEMLAREVDGPIVVQDPEAPDLEDAEHTTLEGEETTRLALVNCDWSELRAVDIFATLQSFVPKGRALFKVSVYLSDYGMKRLAEESRSGPMVTIFSSSSSASSAVAAAADDVTNNNNDSKKKKTKKSSKVVEIGQPKGGRKPRGGDDGEEGEEFDPERLRQYELNRMKYYFAIATFDSSAAASAVYNACDGMEFEASSNVFDLRFVPNDQSFDKYPQRDEASSIPLDYAPPVFATSALQSSKVELTWDGDDSARSRALDWDRVKDPESSVAGTGKARSKKKNKKGGREAPSRTTDLNDLSAYLASSESDDDDDDEEEDEEEEEEEKRKAKKKSKNSEMERKRLRALLLGESSKSKLHTEEEEEEEDEDEEEGREMTITYDPLRVKSAGDILTAKAEREAKEGESAWETYLRKRKEKKKAKKEAYKASSSSSSSSSAAASSALKDDAFFASSTSGKSKTNDDNNYDDDDAEEDDGDVLTSRKCRVSGKNVKTKKGRKNQEEEEEEEGGKKSVSFVDEDKVRAQLELQALGQDDSGDDDGNKSGSNFSLRKLVKSQKALSGKGSKKDIAAAMEKKSKGGGDSEEFKVNVADPRFAAAFARDRPDFSIDPTSAAFKDTVGMREILATRMEDAAMANADGDKKKKRVMVITNAATASSIVDDTKDLAMRVSSKFKKN